MRDLLVLSCSARKTSAPGKLPAIVRYDGPAFRVLRSFLREYCWPGSLSVAVLSARYGLIGGLSHIEWYDQRMTVARSQELAPSVREILAQWSPLHRRVQLVLGKDYLHCLDFFSPPLSEVDVEPAAGAIGRKLQHLKVLLGAIGTQRRRAVDPIPCLHRPLYFLPDWDDFLDLDYAFALDRFSAGSRADRNEGHPISMMRPRRLCDGVVVSLAQHFSSRGFLRPSPMENEASLSPRSVRRRFDLRKDQWAFGDCGAFSYVNDELPPISVEHAVSVYDIYDFDLGASVDHIPVAEIRGRTKRVLLSDSERQWRVTLTRDNADKFIRHREKIGARFIPVGAIQGLTAKDYAAQVGPYLDMGYRHIGLGGLGSVLNWRQPIEIKSL